MASLSETVAIGLSLTTALHHGHSKGFAHNDVKVDNAVFRHRLKAGGVPDPVLVDFWMAREHARRHFGGLVPMYTVPEKMEVFIGQKPPEYIVDTAKGISGVLARCYISCSRLGFLKEGRLPPAFLSLSGTDRCKKFESTSRSRARSRD